MIHVTLAILLGAATTAQATTDSSGIAIAKRLVAAIKGESQFHDADFVKAPGNANKAALRTAAHCTTDRISHTLMTHPTRKGVYMEDPNEVLVTFDCAGVPSNLPVGIVLQLEAGKIKRIETSNFDLMTAR